MVELNNKLKEASKAYYQDAKEIMSNFDYDALYDELVALEKKTGIILSDSVTQNVGYEVLSELKKVEHEKPMLSLDKTKSVEDLQSWLRGSDGSNERTAVLSWKLDGLTIVLTYENGELIKAVTRGNGYIGEDVTNNAKQFKNVPLRIPFKGKLVIRGEAVIKYSDFKEFSDEYKNPRNLCSGSVRQLDPAVTKQRNVNIFIFSLVSSEGENAAPSDSVTKQFEWLKNQGFEVVDHIKVNAKELPDAVKKFAKDIETYDIPSDGLVLLLEDIQYGLSLGTTAKFPRNAIAFKWKDETVETKLKYIEWSPSRTGLINPVAVFEPVEIEGTTVSRASVHNVSIVEELALGEGDVITVYKANMIIPQIAENHTKSGFKGAPDICPACGGVTEIKQEQDVKTLNCTNPDCPAKKIKAFALLASRNALNIDGLSEMTLEKLIGAGFIKTYADLFKLERYRNEIAAMEGFGEKSADNLIEAAKTASKTTLARFIYALGIPGIGAANAKVIAKRYTFDELKNADEEELTLIDGVGEILAGQIKAFFRDEKTMAAVDELLECLEIEDTGKPEGGNNLEGLTFVITGSLETYANRKELEEYIDSMGGKTASSVSAKTSFLINNDILSGSSKNKKAKELGVEIITENDFRNRFVLGNKPT